MYYVHNLAEGIGILCARGIGVFCTHNFAGGIGILCAQPC